MANAARKKAVKMTNLSLKNFLCQGKAKKKNQRAIRKNNKLPRKNEAHLAWNAISRCTNDGQSEQT